MNLFDRTINYMAEICRPLPDQLFKSKHDVIFENNHIKLLDFSTNYTGIPTLIVPPQAGGHSNIADYNPPAASLIQTCLNNERTNLFCIEYKPASAYNNQDTIDDLIHQMKIVIKQLGNEVRIIALCQGVWQSVIYTALYPKSVKEMVLCAGPIDFAGDPENQIYKAAKTTPDFWYNIVLSLNKGIWPGDLQSFGFKMLDPIKKIYEFYQTLFWNIDDEDWLKRHRQFVNWFDTRQDLGSWSVDAAKRLFRDNLLIQDKLIINKSTVKLSNITCPTKILWADKDDITSEKQMTNYKNYAINSHVTETKIENCGHIGAFISNKSLDNYWPLTLKFKN